MSQEPKVTSDRQKKVSRRLKLGGAILAVFLVVLVGSRLALDARNDSGLCLDCHEEHFKSWEASTHASDASCQSCHIAPGFGVAVKSAFQQSKLIDAHAKDPKSSYYIVASVADSSCSACHGKMDAIYTYKDVDVTHAKHIDRSISCSICHEGVVHGDKVDGKHKPTMPTCFQCHDGVQAPKDCNFCHARSVGPPEAFNPAFRQQHASSEQPHPEGFLQSHGVTARNETESCLRCHTSQYCQACHTNSLPQSHQRADFNTAHNRDITQDGSQCFTCHTQDFCMACHATSKPSNHNAAFVKSHGKQSLAGSQDCMLCHKQSYCNACHVLPMPHPSGFLNQHATVSRQQPATCTKCHQESYCNTCHSTMKPKSHAASGFVDAGLHAPLYASSKASCQTCHKSEKFCNDCHTGRKPASHGANYRMAHGKDAAAGKSNCTTCHQRSYCTTCHGEGGRKPSNHEGGFMMKHAEPAKQRGADFCGLCHTQQYCNGCHTALKKPEVKMKN